MKDNIRLPEQFSIEHWLNNKDDIYLYVGNKFGLSFLDSTHTGDEKNIIAFINQNQGTATVIPIKDKLKISLGDVRDYFNNGKIEFIEKKQGISLLSCINKSCQSHIENAFNTIHVAKWGLSVWQISDTGKVKVLAHINHCRNRASFNETASLTSLVNSAKKSAQDAIVLIGHNSVFCKPRQDMTRWFKPFALDKLEHINFKQPYIGIINLKNNKITEFVSKDYIQKEL